MSLIPDKLWYKFDDSSGTSAVDSSGTGLTGTLVGSPTWTTGRGKLGGAIQLNGSTQYLTAGNSSIATNGTICCWIYPTNVSTATNGFAIIENRAGTIGASTDLNYAFEICGSALGGGALTGKLLGVTFSGGVNYALPADTTAISANTWTHVAFVVTSTTYAFYRNGAVSSSGVLGYPLTAWTGTTTTIGTSKDTLNNSRFAGKIDDLRVFSRALSANEMSQIYNQSFAQFME